MIETRTKEKLNLKKGARNTYLYAVWYNDESPDKIALSRKGLKELFFTLNKGLSKNILQNRDNKQLDPWT